MIHRIFKPQNLDIELTPKRVRELLNEKDDAVRHPTKGSRNDNPAIREALPKKTNPKGNN
jgi:hypothetical protein